MNKYHFHLLWTAFALTVLTMAGCRTEPIIPEGGIPTEPPVQDPGVENLCDPGIISFQHEILPLLISSCAYSGCHDATSHKEGVVLDSYERAMREVKAGNADRSSLYRSVTRGGEEFMPPRPATPLTTEQTNLIRDWINQGANNTDCGTACDPAESSFSGTVFPMIQNFCVGCHSNSRADGGVNLSDYDRVRSYAQTGALIGAISHDPYYAAMPPSGSALSACRIAQVQKWIDEGMKNN
ncbi:MAG: c-type cytochrome domain-containing protein [Saprospiraceae bacterium]